MLRRVIIIAVFLLTFLSGCSADGPVSVIDQDENLSLELVLPKSKYQEDEEIICKAVLTYIGEDQTFEFSTGDPAVMFAIDGGEYSRAILTLSRETCFFPKKSKEARRLNIHLKNTREHIWIPTKTPLNSGENFLRGNNWF